MGMSYCANFLNLLADCEHRGLEETKIERHKNTAGVRVLFKQNCRENSAILGWCKQRLLVGSCDASFFDPRSEA